MCMNNETIIYPFTEFAKNELFGLAFNRIDKIAIAVPIDKPPYLIVDYEGYTYNQEKKIAPGNPYLEKKRMVINFNDEKVEVKYDDATKDSVWLGQKK